MQKNSRYILLLLFLVILTIRIPQIDAQAFDPINFIDDFEDGIDDLWRYEPLVGTHYVAEDGLLKVKPNSTYIDPTIPCGHACTDVADMNYTLPYMTERLEVLFEMHFDFTDRLSNYPSLNFKITPTVGYSYDTFVYQVHYQYSMYFNGYNTLGAHDAFNELLSAPSGIIYFNLTRIYGLFVEDEFGYIVTAKLPSGNILQNTRNGTTIDSLATADVLQFRGTLFFSAIDNPFLAWDNIRIKTSGKPLAFFNGTEITVPDTPQNENDTSAKFQIPFEWMSLGLMLPVVIVYRKIVKSR